MSHEIKLGQLIDDERQQRDAIHIAVAPVDSIDDKLEPGQAIGLVKGSKSTVTANTPNLIGIVDPFLKEPVRKYERFFMFLFPNTVTGMRHHWEHPAFENKDESEAWLRDFIRNADCPDFDTVIAAATGQHVDRNEYYSGPAYENDGEYLFFRGRDAHGEIPPEFWDHVEIYTGIRCPERPSRFSCSC